jgi:predicted deacetylase
MAESPGPLQARYLIRFDDLCPTMNWQAWGVIESLLEEMNARPLLAIIPDNRDPTQRIEDARGDFWDAVRSWQARGWTIGLHGYQHLFVTQDRGLLGHDDRSEFAGLSKSEQEDKIRRGLAVFEREGITTQTWVAPNHSFDATTLDVLRETGVRVISDGNALYPYVDPEGMMWIPRQLYRFTRRPLGVWTICLHPNRWTERDLSKFARNLRTYADRLTGVDSILSTYGDRSRGFVDSCFSAQRRIKRGIDTGISIARRASPGRRRLVASPSSDASDDIR